MHRFYCVDEMYTILISISKPVIIFIALFQVVSHTTGVERLLYIYIYIYIYIYKEREGGRQKDRQRVKDVFDTCSLVDRKRNTLIHEIYLVIPFIFYACYYILYIYIYIYIYIYSLTLVELSSPAKKYRVAISVHCKPLHIWIEVSAAVERMYVNNCNCDS